MSLARDLRGLAACGVTLVSVSAALAFQAPQRAARFDHLVRYSPAHGLAVEGAAPETLPPAARAGWASFVAQQGGAGWAGWFDRRSGLPTLIQGRGIPWVAGRGNNLAAGGPVTTERLAALARSFLETHALLLGRWGAQLQLEVAASGPITENVWQIAFRQVVDGVPVEGAGYTFHVAQGNLVAFGAQALAPVRRGTTPRLAVGDARAALAAYLGQGSAELLDVTPPRLHLLPVDPRGTKERAWDAEPGAGYAHELAWRFVTRVPGEAPTWVAEVSADDGAILSFHDDTKYERVMGGVFPVSDDGLCPTGCEQPDFPMPFADYSVGGGPVQYTGDHGLYACSQAGATVRSTLNGPYIRVSDGCGSTAETADTTACDPIDFRSSAGTDCDVPAGSSPGNTHAARSSFYHLNRAMEKGRSWLPDNDWLASQLTDNVNIDATCNAYWNGSVNFYRSGGGCRNTGEIAGVFVHEWGHGLDANDGGGYDNPSEAYADVVAFFETRESCIGRGFFTSQNCSGYGNACLDCTGIRDQDWNKRAFRTPSTPDGFTRNHCDGGSGACAKEVHCEGYLAGETVWDLAVRDLPASGMDTASAWQQAEQLFYLSRKNSGGNAYNCSLPGADGCGTSNWFHTFRLVDDDDGNLANGTPHAAAIFSAFSRHKIACGNADDAANQSTSHCPALPAPEVGVQAGSNRMTLRWNAVPGATRYNILRNDLGCERAQIIIDRVAAPATAYVDDAIANNFPVYYRIQAVAERDACVSPVSACVSSAAQPFAGTVRFERATYGCSTDISLRVTDGNTGATHPTVKVWSSTEPAPEVLTLRPSAPGSATFVGSIPSTSSPAAAGDGRLSIRHGDTLSVEYIDADDGNGGINVPQTAGAVGDCVDPVVSGVRDADVTDRSVTIRWSTDEPSDAIVLWGPTHPPGSSTTGASLATDHAVPLGDLQPCTVYWYEVRSTDAAGNLAIANDGGRYYHFETQGRFGGVMQPCHQGRLTLSKDVLGCSDAVDIELVDIDLNPAPAVAETVVVTLSSTTETTPEPLALTETGPNTSTFRGTARVAQGSVVSGDGVVQIADGDTFTATYRDGDDGTGERRTAFATAVDDCAASAVNVIRVIDIADDGATIRVATAEPTTVRVEWGTTPALGSAVADGVLQQSHDLRIGPLAECGRAYFRVQTADRHGNANVVDAGGQPFAFNASIIPGLFRDGFETATGWTLEGEWQIGAPEGKGSAQADPTAAFAGAKVLGQDLTGLGANPGDYEVHTNERAISPVIDAASLSRTQLTFRRWLNVGNGGIAHIEVKRGPDWFSVWNSNSVLGNADSAWTLQTIDLSRYADGNGKFQLAFRLFAGPGNQSSKSSWNVDRLVLKSANDPDYDACGGCGGAPAFGGATAVVDDDACAAGSVTVRWYEAPAWGSGRPGSYAVYRDTNPGFTPGSSNRIAAGVAGTSYIDTTAPDGAMLYYIVRAENAETCSTGPANGGVTDGNTRTVSVLTSSSRAVPPALTGLSVTRINDAHLRLTWLPNAGAASYRVYRSLMPLAGGFGSLGSVAAAVYDDTGAGANREAYYYLVRGVNACGTEGP